MTHFKLSSGAALLVAASFSVGLFGCSTENSADSLRCFTVKCTDNDYDDEDEREDDDDYDKGKSSSSTTKLPRGCDNYVSSLSIAPHCYPEDFGTTLYDEDTKTIYSCEENGYTIEGYWQEHNSFKNCDEYVSPYSNYKDWFSSSSDEEDWFTSSSSDEYFDDWNSSSSEEKLPIIEGELFDDRDGNIYKTVTIGTQTWMAENLKYRYLQPTEDLDSSSFCYNETIEDCDKYGRYYLWSAAMDSAGYFTNDGLGCGNGVYCEPTYPVQGLCPDGWHLPSYEEAETLLEYTHSKSDGGQSLKATDGWVIPGTDEYGFNVLASGIWNPGDSIHAQGTYGEGWDAEFWASTEFHNTELADIFYVYISEEDITEHSEVDIGSKWRGLHIRCLKDSE